MKNYILFALLMLGIVACRKEDSPSSALPIIIAATGDITVSVNKFRDLLGATLNTSPGHTSGRREINWDAVPDEFSSQKIPSDFFNPVGTGANTSLQRGFRYSPATDARVSVNDFADLDITNQDEFEPFSGNKTFSAVNAFLWDVFFEVPGESASAGVHGFGAVFTDVDVAGSASIEYFAGTRSLGEYAVPVTTNGKHSFLAVYFPNEQVTKIRVKQGSASVASNMKDISAGGTNDLVVMDDFLYDEPQKIN